MGFPADSALADDVALLEIPVGHQHWDGVSEYGQNSYALATEHQHVSVIELIANPERYDKKSVWIQGYLVLESENDALYLSEWEGRMEYAAKSGKIVSV